MKTPEEFLQSKGIWNHPYVYETVSDKAIKEGYDVAELIEEYAAQSRQEAVEWISVHYELPYDDDKYLCYVKSTDRVMIWKFTDGNDWSDKGVTHWMELPSKPKPTE